MKKYIFIILGLWPCIAFCTAQRPEEIIYHGETNYLLTVPLTTEIYVKIRNYNHDAPTTRNTAWRRGVAGLWELKDETFYLRDVSRSDGVDVPAEVISTNSTYPIKATWYSGELRIAQGERVESVNYGFDTVLEKETFIPIENGKVSGTIEIFDRLNEKTEFIQYIDGLENAENQSEQDQYVYARYFDGFKYDKRLTEHFREIYPSGGCSNFLHSVFVWKLTTSDKSRVSLQKLIPTNEPRIYMRKRIFKKASSFWPINYVAYQDDRIIVVKGHPRKGVELKDAEAEAFEVISEIKRTLANQRLEPTPDGAAHP